MSLITENNALGNGSNPNFSFTFKYVKESDVYVSVDDAPQTLNTHYTFAPNTSSITFLPAHIPALNAKVRIYRETSLTDPAAEFFPGSAIRAQDLNNNNDQVLFSAQERLERSLNTTGGTITGNVTVNGDVIFEGLTDDANETTVNVVDPTQDNTITLPNASGHVPLLAVTSTTQITSTPAELNKLTGVNTTAAEFNHVNGVTSAIQTQIDGKQPLDSELTELATMDALTASSLADLTSTEVQILDNLTVPTADLNLIQGLQATSAELNTLSGITSSTNELNKLTSVNTTAAEFNKLSGLNASTANLDITNNMTKSTSLVSSSDTEYPTSKAVADYVTTQLAAIDGFVAVATPTDVPGASGTAVPAGVTISIADAGALPVDSNGQAQYSNIGSVNNVSGQVTITGIAAPFRPAGANPLGVSAGVRFLIEGTGTAGSYIYHGSALKEQDLVNLSSDINDFGNRYRVFNAGKNADNDTSNHSGDLCFDVPAGKMFVYDAPTQVAGSGSWGEVQSVGDFILIPDSELANFTGTTPTATTNITNAPAVAQQILLVINGVIQKASSGTGTPTEGFTLSGATITLAAAPPANSSVFGIILGSSVNVPVVGAGSVNTLQLADFGVTNIKLHNTAGSEAVNTNVIRANAVTDVKLASHASTDANRAVGQNHIKTQAVTAAKLSPSLTGNGNKFLRLNAGATDLEYADVPAPSISNASTFTGDNTTTTFTIVTGHTVHSILVVLNGLVLRPTTDYTVSGTDLTFTSAPGTGDEIDVRYLPI